MLILNCFNRKSGFPPQSSLDHEMVEFVPENKYKKLSDSENNLGKILEVTHSIIYP